MAAWEGGWGKGNEGGGVEGWEGGWGKENEGGGVEGWRHGKGVGGRGMRVVGMGVIDARAAAGAACLTDLMSDQCDARIVQVQPGRDLPIGHDEDVPHPGSVLHH